MVITIPLIDISKGSQALLIEVAVTDATGFESLNLSFKHATDSSVPAISAYSYDEDPYWGTAKNGKYIVVAKIPASTEPGSYTLSSINSKDKAGNSTNISGVALANYLISKDIDLSSFAFNVTGTAPPSVDKTVPIITKLAFSSNTVDLSKGPQTLVLEAAVTDQTGLASLYLNFISSANSADPSWSISYSDDNLYSGNLKNGKYIVPVEIPESTKPGTVHLSSLSITDKAGNRMNLSGIAATEYLKSIGLDPLLYTVKVPGVPAATADTIAPRITSLLPSSKSIDLSKGAQTVLLEVSITDKTGFESLTIRFDNTSKNSNSATSLFASFYGPDNLYSGTLKNGKYIDDISIPASTSPGSYQPSWLSIRDKVGNLTNLSGVAATDYLKSIGIDPTLCTIDITGTSPSTADRSGPAITSFSIKSNPLPAKSPSIDVSSGKLVVNLDIDFTSRNGLGTLSQYPFDDWGYFTLEGPSGQKMTFGISAENLVTGTSKSGKLRVSTALPSGLEPGKWVFSEIELIDLSGYILRTPWDFTADETSSIFGVDPGSLSLDIVNTNTPVIYTGPKVNAIRISDNSYDVTSGKTVGSIEIDFTDVVGLGANIEFPLKLWGWLSFTGPSGQDLYFGITPESLIAGTSKNGTLRVNTPFSSGLEAGSWYLSEYQLGSLSGFRNSAFTSEVIAKILDVSLSSLSFDIINTNKVPIDPAPVISSIKFGAKSYDVTAGNINGTLDIDFVDSYGLGFPTLVATPINYWGTLNLRGPSGQDRQIYLTEANLVAGTNKAGTLRVSISLSAGLEPGNWTISRLSLADVAGYVRETPWDSTPDLIAKFLSIDLAPLSVQIVNKNAPLLSPPVAISSFDVTTSTTPLPVVLDVSGKVASAASLSRRNTSLSSLTATVPLKTEASKLLERYKINDSTSSTPKKASDIDSSFIDFTIKTGALKALTAEIALDKEVKANAYVKVNPNTGEAFDFTYDPISGLGAELLDTNKNGLVDTLKIHLQDGAKGDVDGLINGEIRDPGVLAEAPRQSVYRFFKASKGVHLYTSSDAERANVNANPQWGYKDEGVAYEALVTQGKALHRFFNAKASYHFMTTNDEEAKNVIANPQWGFTYEGESFSVSTISQVGMSTPVNRFYRVLDGVGQHFYTASADEANNILAHPEWGYKSEGVGWYV